jgi:hypothetical protein
MGERPRTVVEAALYELCVTYGYCASSPELDALVVRPPRTADELVDAVLAAEGVDLDPALADKAERARLRAVVEDWLFAPDGKGARSGLPTRVPDD